MPRTEKADCAKCNTEIKTARYCLTCVTCQNHYHVRCTIVSPKLFALMDNDKKLTWKCSTCNRKPKSPPKLTINITPSRSNITQRQNVLSKDLSEDLSTDNVTLRQKTSDQASHSNLQTPNSSLDESPENSLNTSTQSMPDTIEIAQISELKDRIEVLTTELTSAHEEIAILNIEITRLTKDQTDLERQITTLKNLLSKETSTPVRRSITKQKKRDLNLSARKAKQPNRTPNRSITSLNNEKPMQNTPQPSLLEQKETDKDVVDTDECCENIKKLKVNNSSTLPNKYKSPRKIFTENKKLAIISTNNKHQISKLISNNNVLNKFSHCHYITPAGGTKGLLHELTNKLADFTINDYCIILVG